MEFNNHVSMLRIRSEHAIGYLKGRFQSMKNLRINIRDEATHKIATYWILGCIAVHSFAMQQEEKEKDTDESDCAYWDFIQEGLSEDDEAMRMQAPEPPVVGDDGGLPAGKGVARNSQTALIRCKGARSSKTAEAT